MWHLWVSAHRSEVSPSVRLAHGQATVRVPTSVRRGRGAGGVVCGCAAVAFVCPERRRPSAQGNPKNSTFCRFQRPLYLRMRALRGTPGQKEYGEHTLWGQLQKRLPPVVVRYIRAPLLKAAQKRMDYITWHIEERCLVKWPEREVFITSPLAPEA